jgi:hypothetical protein
MTSSERRRHARFPFERHLEIWATDQINPMIVRAHDISQGGFSFVTDIGLRVGDNLVLGLRDVDDFLVKATVRNVRQAGDGYLVGAERLEGV